MLILKGKTVKKNSENLKNLRNLEEKNNNIQHSAQQTDLTITGPMSHKFWLMVIDTKNMGKNQLILCYLIFAYINLAL